MTNATAQVLGSVDDLLPHQDAITDLFASLDLPATARLGPISTWLRHHPRSTPFVVLVSRGDRLAAAALMMRTARPGLRKYELIGEPGVPNHLPAVDAEAAHELARAMRRALLAQRRPWVLNLRDVEDSDPVAAAILAQWPRSYRCHTYDSPRISFAPGSDLGRYVSRNTRAAVAKARNRIKRDGVPFAMDWLDDPAAIAATVPEMVELYRARSDQTGQSRGLLHAPGYRAYFADMLTSHALGGQASLLTVRMDGTLASYAMCLQNRKVTLVYSNRASPDWLHYSPGTIANAEVVRSAFADGAVSAVDWGGGIQRYKLSGHAALYPHFDVRASSSWLTQRSFDAMRRSARTVRRIRHLADQPGRLIDSWRGPAA